MKPDQLTYSTASGERLLARKIGAAIAAHRERLGMTQEALADQIRVGNQAISRIERGAVMTTLPRLLEFADIFGIGVDELIMFGSTRVLDQSEGITKLLEPLHPEDREVITAVVRQLAAHFPKRPSRRRSS